MKIMKFIIISFLIILNTTLNAWANKVSPHRMQVNKDLEPINATRIDVPVIKPKYIKQNKTLTISPISHKSDINNDLEKSLDYTSIIFTVKNNYKGINQNTWNMYFKSQAKRVQKQWCKEALLKNPKYNTSYARVLLFVDKDGSIRNYDIKSSCIPKNDKEYIKLVKLFLNNFKFDKLPSGYNADVIGFSIKFHSIPPSKINMNNLEWDRYGVADIEVSNKRSMYINKSVGE